MVRWLKTILAVAAIAPAAFAQVPAQQQPNSRPSAAAPNGPAHATTQKSQLPQGAPEAAPRASRNNDTRKSAPLDPHRKFVLDVVKSAVALPQPDSQDRLRVLHSAVSVVAPVDAKLARQLSQEGVRLESDLIEAGQQPAVSLFDAGSVDCATAAEFVQNLPAGSVTAAEQSLLGAIGSCPKQTVDLARQKLEAALDAGVLAPRALLATMEAAGPNSAWVQPEFVKMFGALPRDYEKFRHEAPNYSAMYIQLAPEVDKDAARKAGLKLLDWLARVPEGGERNLAVNMATNAMQQALGAEKYQEALSSDVMAAGIARTAGGAGEIDHPEEQNVSVLQAMGESGMDKTEDLQKLPPSQRAREAAAHGFAAGTGGDRKLADRYFDMAFSSANEVWAKRGESAGTGGSAAPAVVEEISEAAAQVDAPSALVRAQHLDDPTAQAIGMLAVARVVLGQQNQ